MCEPSARETKAGPQTPPLPPSRLLPGGAAWALRSIAHHHTTHGGRNAALSWLLDVAGEMRRQQQSPVAGDTAAEVFFCRLLHWPLPTLTRCASRLRMVRRLMHEWILTVTRGAGGKAGGAAGPIPAAGTRYRRLYNVCLWQRRHPLFILTPVLDAFGESLSCGEVNDMLEAISQHLVGRLNNIPHLLRCDVLMTYPKLPFAQQQELMEVLRAGYSLPTTTTTDRNANNSKSNKCRRAGSGFSGKSETSESPPSPDVYLADYVPSVPTRFGVHDLSAESYTKLRQAFEQHKQAGVRRLLSCTS